ncbi:hypothetical protein SK128_025183 [Halocaridina rubra]|uniref:MAM domain-containing protein n=1 Tax=Halocaridina rubra TaxID=373956 RepID=A0AAN8ZZM3_HALRR
MEVQLKTGSVPNNPRLITRLLRPAHHMCSLYLDYKLYIPSGPEPQLNIYLEHEASDFTLLFRVQHSIEEWQQLQLPLGAITSDFQLLIEVSQSADPNAVAAVDEIRLTNCWPPGTCGDLPDGYVLCSNDVCIPSDAVCDFTNDCGDYSDEASCENYPMRCDFERAFCGWHTSTFNSTLSRKSPIPPFRDHSVNTGDGHHIVFLSDVPAKSYITSPIIQPSENCLLRVYYVVAGASTTYLNIKLISSDTFLTVESDIITAYEQEVFYWQRYVKAFTYTDGGFYLNLEADIQDRGYIAIDDISLSPECMIQGPTQFPPTVSPTSGPCPPGEYFCESGENCLPFTKVCDFDIDCGIGEDEEFCGSSTFEWNTGGWYDTSDGLYKWSRVNASAAFGPNDTAPANDHTNSGAAPGYYLWAAAKNAGYPEGTAVMMSPEVGPPGMQCSLQFWYHCKNKKPILSATLYTANYSREQINQQTFGCSSNQEWRHAYIYAGDQNTTIVAEMRSLLFESRNDPVLYDVAIDDVSYTSCSKNEPNADIDIECTFDEPCGLYNNHQDDIDWIRVVEQFNSYMMVKGPHSGATAILQSWWRSASVGICVSFRYFIEGRANFTITRVLKDGTSPEIIWMSDGSMNYLDWRIHHLSIYSYLDYQVKPLKKIECDYKYAVTAPIICRFVHNECKTKLWFTGQNITSSQRIKIDDVQIYSGKCPAQLTCTFEEMNDYCFWENRPIGGSTLDWMLANGLEHIANTPDYDHSFGTESGHYVYIPISQDTTERFGYYSSLNINTTTDDGDCFRFWFYLYAVDQPVGELGIRILEAGSVTPNDRIWEHTYNGRNTWQYGETTLTNETDFAILLEGLRLDGTSGIMAWDDLSVTRGPCMPPGSCDFEGGLCGWINSQDEYGNSWEWLKAEEASDGVLIDHTTGTGIGHYISFDLSNCAYGTTCSADFISSDITPVDDMYCLSMFLNSYQSSLDANTVMLEVVNVELNTSVLVRSFVNQFQYIWTYVRQPLVGVTSVFHLKLKAKMLPGRLDVGAFSAIDDIQLTPGECGITGTTIPPTGTPAPDSKLTCSFEDGTLCNWSQNDVWTLKTGFEEEGSIHGPFVDHTTALSSGHFVVTESQGSKQTGKLISERLSPSQTGYCLTFYYYMHGSAPPYLKMYIVKDGLEPTDGPVWEHFKELGETWQKVSLFMNVTYDFNVLFHAETQDAIEDLGHASIDDFLLIDGTCQEDPANFCDFETSDLCEWVSTNLNGVSWDWGSGKESAPENQPLIDHTFGSEYGHYVFLKHLGGDSSTSRALLTSPTHSSSNSMCFTFYYYMHGRTNWTGSLDLYITEPSIDINDVEPVWSIVGDKGDSWNLARKSLSFGGNYHVSFKLENNITVT